MAPAHAIHHTAKTLRGLAVRVESSTQGDKYYRPVIGGLTEPIHRHH